MESMRPNIVTVEPDASLRRCYDCQSLKAAVSWWCTNREAIKWRGTQIPGVHNCPFWEPATMKREDVSWWKRLMRYR